MISALAPWFGGNRLLAHHVGEAMEGCSWVGILFAGGMPEVPHITARTILVNDKHRHIINLARVVAHDLLRPVLVRRLKNKAFHPDELKACQERCKLEQPGSAANIDLAEAYFVACWMGRSGKAGGKDELNGKPATRWNASGGDSAVRYYGAVRMLAEFSRSLRRCTFLTEDAFDFLARCEDTKGHGIYADPPFPVAGRKYIHNAGFTDSGERQWHTQLRDALARFKLTRIVCRFYDHPLIRELYPKDTWDWRSLLGGKKQTNDEAPEILLIRNAANVGSLFEV